MSKTSRDIGLILVAVFITFIACWFVAKSFMGAHTHTDDTHQLLHQQLNLNNEQDHKLEAIERNFIDKKQALEASVQIANQALAAAIAQDQSYSVAVKQAVEKIHAAQGELQQLTLQHLFDMGQLLTPEQQAALNKLAIDALMHGG